MKTPPHGWRGFDYQTEQKKRRKTITGIAVPAVSVCLIAALGLGLRQAGLLRPETPLTETDADSEVPGSVDETEEQGSADADPAEEKAIAAAVPDALFATEDGSRQKGPESESADSVVYLWWNRLNVSGPLKFAIDDNPGAALSVLATYRPATANITSFLYEGKTLAEWAVEAFEENASQEAKKEYKLAYNAYLETVLPEIISRLTESGIPCERAAYTNNGLTILVTAEQLKNLPLDDMEGWYFDLYSGDLKGTADPITDEVTVQIVD